MKKIITLLSLVSSLCAVNSNPLTVQVYSGVLPFPGAGVSIRHVNEGADFGFEVNGSGSTLLFCSAYQGSINGLCYPGGKGAYLGLGAGIGIYPSHFYKLESSASLIVPFFFGYQFKKGFVDAGVTYAPMYQFLPVYPSVRFGLSF